MTTVIAVLSTGGNSPLAIRALKIIAMWLRVSLPKIFFSSVQGIWSFPGADQALVVLRTVSISAVVMSCHVLVVMGIINSSKLCGSHSLSVGGRTK